MSLPTLIVGKEYLINSPYGKSGKYILSEVNSDKNKPLEIMYMFTDVWGNKVGFINRLFNPRGIKVILLLPPPPLPPPVPQQFISLPIEQQNFWDNNDAPITAPITNSNKVHDLNKFPLDEDLYI
jgi:hypothetical protein